MGKNKNRSYKIRSNVRGQVNLPQMCSHMETLQIVTMQPINPDMDVDTSRLNLQTLVECQKWRSLTWDTLTQCGQSGNQKRKQERWINLLMQEEPQHDNAYWIRSCEWQLSSPQQELDKLRSKFFRGQASSCEFHRSGVALVAHFPQDYK